MKQAHRGREISKVEEFAVPHGSHLRLLLLKRDLRGCGAVLVECKTSPSNSRADKSYRGYSRDLELGQ